MTTLIALYNSNGCASRCDANCYNATTPRCTCICGGRNHGVGLRQAANNTILDCLAIEDDLPTIDQWSFDTDVKFNQHLHELAAP